MLEAECFIAPKTYLRIQLCYQLRIDSSLVCTHHENNAGLLLVLQLCRPKDALLQHGARLPVFEHFFDPF